jgi:antitoxin HigA-1
MTRMHNPPHPGEILQDTVLRSDGGMTVTAFSKRLGVSRVALSRVVNGRAAISAELAIRLRQLLEGQQNRGLPCRPRLIYGMPPKRGGPRSSPLQLTHSRRRRPSG